MVRNFQDLGLSQVIIRRHGTARHCSRPRDSTFQLSSKHIGYSAQSGALSLFIPLFMSDEKTPLLGDRSTTRPVRRTRRVAWIWLLSLILTLSTFGFTTWQTHFFGLNPPGSGEKLPPRLFKIGIIGRIGSQLWK